MNDLLEVGSDVLVNDKTLNEIEKVGIHLPQVECPVVHHFLPGFYLREFRAHAGTFIISKIHKQVNLFSVTKGSVSVWDEKNGVQLIKAGDTGITQPGTRRALYVHEDLVWVTAHPMMETNLENIEKILIDDSPNPLLSEDEKHIFNSIKQFHAQNPNDHVLPDSE